MRSELLQFVFYAIAHVLGGACEELLPKVFGVGFPILLALTVSVAARRSTPAMILFALAAGAFEDALSSPPTMTSPCFFLVAALVVWRTHLAKLVLIFAYPIYEVWLAVLVPGHAGSLVARLLMSVPIVALTAFAVCPVFAWLERKAAVDEA